MIVELGNLTTRIVKAEPDEKEWLAEYLSFPDRKAHFRSSTPRWKNDGMVRMLSEVTLAFPTGFIKAVQAQAKTDSIKVEVVDRRTPAPALDPSPMLDWLRDYQQAAIEVAKEAEVGVFHHATGGGKTELIIGLTELRPTAVTLVLTHRKQLMHQTAARFAKRTGEQVGKFGDGHLKIERVTIAMFNTVYKRARLKHSPFRKWLDSITMVIVDECHIVPARTFWKVMMAIPNARLRYGFSATPFARGDKKSLYTWGSLGPIIHRVSAQTLIAAGVLAKPKIRMMLFKHTATQVSDWGTIYADKIVNNKLRNDAAVAAAEEAVKPCFVFVNHVAHGNKILDQLRARGAKVEFVWGKHKTALRNAAIERMVHGETDIIVCNVIFQEGLDVPELQSIVIAQGGMSTIATLQRLGRGTRRHNSVGDVTKDTFNVYDFKDRGCGCKHPSKHRACMYLEKHARARIKAYLSERFDITEVFPPILRAL